MKLNRYGVIQSNPSRPHVDVIGVPNGDNDIIAAVFGPSTYSNNQASMRKEYTHTSDVLSIPVLTFKPRTTAESLRIAAHDFKNFAKPQIFDPRWLQAGYIIRDSEGVWFNPLNADRAPVDDMNTLKSLRDKADKIRAKSGNVYIGQNGFGFAEYGSFTQGVQDKNTFVKEGLALGLENTKGPVAKNLNEIADEKNYPKGIDVFGFAPSKEPIRRVVSLYSNRAILGDRLFVYGDYWDDDDGGCAFGGISSAEGTAQKK